MRYKSPTSGEGQAARGESRGCNESLDLHGLSFIQACSRSIFQPTHDHRKKNTPMPERSGT